MTVSKGSPPFRPGSLRGAGGRSPGLSWTRPGRCRSSWSGLSGRIRCTWTPSGPWAHLLPARSAVWWRVGVLPSRPPAEARARRLKPCHEPTWAWDRRALDLHRRACRGAAETVEDPNPARLRRWPPSCRGGDGTLGLPDVPAPPMVASEAGGRGRLPGGEERRHPDHAGQRWSLYLKQGIEVARSHWSGGRRRSDGTSLIRVGVCNLPDADPGGAPIPPTWGDPSHPRGPLRSSFGGSPPPWRWVRRCAWVRRMSLLKGKQPPC